MDVGNLFTKIKFMKICQVLASAGNGGLERHFVDLCRALSRQHEVHAVALPSVLKGLPDAVVKHPLDLMGWRYNPLMQYRLRKLVRDINPDVLHAQANKAASLCAPLAKTVPCAVATVHNQKRSVGMFSTYDAVIAVSSQAAASFSDITPEVIWNGIEPDNVVCDRPDDVPDSYVLSVGRLVEAKGFDRLLDAWKNRREMLLIAGDGPDASALEQQVERLQLQDRVRLLGFRKDVKALMQHSDVLVVASRREGFPYVLVEALHARCRIVSTRIPGTEDFLISKCLMPVDSLDSLSDALDYAVSDEATADYEAAWDKAAQLLTLDAMANKTLALYDRILSAHQPGTR